MLDQEQEQEQEQEVSERASSSSSQENLEFVMKLKAKDGTVERVVVSPHDDPLQLANAFRLKHNLSEAMVASLASKIERQRNEFLLLVLDRPPQQTRQSPVPRSRLSPIRSAVPAPTLTVVEQKSDDRLPSSVAKEVIDGFLGTFVVESRTDINDGIGQGNQSTITNNYTSLVDEAGQEEIYNRAMLSAYPQSVEPDRRSPERSSENWDGVYGDRINDSSTSSPSVFNRLYHAASLQRQYQEQLVKRHDEHEQQKVESSRYRLPRNSPYNSKNFRSPLVKEGENFGYNLYHRDLMWVSN